MGRLSETPVKLRTNPYRGPNAHLLSVQQTPDSESGGLWHGFHNAFVAALSYWLNDRLPPGYTSFSDQSLQIEIEMPDQRTEISRCVPDVAAYRNPGYQPAGSETGVLEAVTASDLVLIVEDTRTDTELAAVTVYKDVPHRALGEPVVRIELLLAANKYGGSGYGSYRRGRLDAFRAGTILYELDVLHETPSPIDEIPIYPAAPGSHPYYIAVTNPHRAPLKTQVKFFNVDDPFPLVNILLLGDDVVRDFDMGPAYNETFERGRWGRLLDYADEPDPMRQNDLKTYYSRTVPAAIETYSAADQERIREKMHTIVHNASAQDTA